MVETITLELVKVSRALFLNTNMDQVLLQMGKVSAHIMVQISSLAKKENRLKNLSNNGQCVVSE